MELELVKTECHYQHRSVKGWVPVKVYWLGRHGYLTVRAPVGGNFGEGAFKPLDLMLCSGVLKNPNEVELNVPQTPAAYP